VDLFPQLTALQNVGYGPRQVRVTPKRDAQEQARKQLAEDGHANRAEQYRGELEGGQGQRDARARARAGPAEVMVFDEPTSALDPELRPEVLQVMQALAEGGMTMIVVTHEIAFARKVGTRLIFMEKGKIAVDGPPAELIDNPSNPRLREFL